MGKSQTRIFDRTFGIEYGSLANQADGAVLVRENETTILVTVVASPEPKAGIDFFPLTVDYRERFSAAGKFPGGYRKREGQASVREVLTSRLIDRSIRPLFPKSFRCETQVLATVLSVDPDGDPPILGIIGASAALQLSSIPWDGPVAAIRVGRSEEGAWIANPTAEERAVSSLDLIATIGRRGLIMLEGSAKELPEAEILEALEFAGETLRPLLEAVDVLRAEGVGKRKESTPPVDQELVAAVEQVSAEVVLAAASTAEKAVRKGLLAQAREQMLEKLSERFEDRTAGMEAALEDLVARTFRRRTLDEGVRADGRASDAIRPIHCEVGWIPRVHGSATFTRGETQSLAVCTLGTGADEQEVEGLHGVEREAFQLYYRFPSYSVGEVRPLRAPSRREIGHGTLARRGLEPILPSSERFPYTIKLESEITSSNGSSSMASICSGCLALMDAGVPIREPVAGIAMGLIQEGEKTTILSDILGDEDHLGDMDFKVAGTKRGVTAIQLDNKIGALGHGLLVQAVEQARLGRLHILSEMSKVLGKPRPDLSPHAPRIERLTVSPNRIRALIGPGGRTIQALQRETETKVDVQDDGTVRVFAQGSAGLDHAVRLIRDLTGEPEVGKIYRGSVITVKDFGCFVRLFEGIEGLVHVSELADGRTADPGQVASPGDEMVVVVLGVDEKGKISLSRKQALNVAESEIANA